jgi:aspartate carbamoyltransferase catalytic subunit
MQPPEPLTEHRIARRERHHILDLDDFSQTEIEEVLSTAESMKEILAREIKQVPTLRGKTVVTLFGEESTLTRISFELAAHALSATCINYTLNSTTANDGVSLQDTVRTLQALGADILVMRHSCAGAPYLAAQHFSGAVINAGDGSHAHPTQALRNLLTIREHLDQIEQRKVVLVGDVLHSHVTRSNLWALTKMGAEVTLCAPPTLLGPPRFWQATWPDVRVSYNLDESLEGAEVVMLLRLQPERQRAGLLPSLREYSRFFALTSERMERLGPNVLVIHSDAAREGIEIAADVIAAGQPIREAQVTNGVAIRMALLYQLAHTRAEDSA